QYHKRASYRLAMQQQKRALRLRQLRLAREHDAENAPSQAANPLSPTTKRPDALAPALLPSGTAAPSGWKTTQSSPAELKFRVDNSSGDQVGAVSISVIGPAMPESPENRRQSVGGVSTAALRRDVIDRMIRENGWVVNDYQKVIDGQNVYVVVAQSQ